MSLVHGYLDDMNECATETITESTVAESGNLEPSEPPDNDYENREKIAIGQLFIHNGYWSEVLVE
jgi:hypothetical protein